MALHSSSSSSKPQEISSLNTHKITISPCSVNHPQSLNPQSQPRTRRRGLTSIVLPPTLLANFTSSGSFPSARPWPSPSLEQTQSPHNSSLVASYFSWQPGAPDLDARSPATKRPPRSSHVVAPALSTQRTHSTETAWRLPPAYDTHVNYPQLTPRALATLAAENLAQAKIQKSPSFDPELISNDFGPKPVNVNIVEEAEGVMSTTVTEYSSSKIHKISDKKMSYRRNSNSTRHQNISRSDSHSSQEDLFLNLATTDKPIEKAVNAPTPNERQFTQETMSKSRPRTMTFEDRTTEQQPVDGRSPTAIQQPDNRVRQYSASAHPLNPRHRSRLSGGAANISSNASHLSFDRESSPESPQNYIRRPSVPESTTGVPSRSYYRSNLPYLTNGKYTPSPLTGRPISKSEHDIAVFAPRAEGTESTVSTTAPSTVWDELDDLKSRIKKLELTGKMPSSSGAAISTATGERPLTATTTVTTISSSPKHDHGKTFVSPGNSGADISNQPTTHPLLASALAKSKASISTPMYKALEATASDAIGLANMTSSGAKGSVPNGIDRQLKRRADNMCRSLTELCIALSEEKSNSANATSISRPGSQDNSLRQQRIGNVDEPKSHRGGIPAPEPISSSRVLSRLEARRSSVLVLGSTHTCTSVLRERYPEIPPPTQESASSNPLARTSTVLQRIRRTTEEDADKTIRPLSRAMTELSHPRPAPRQTAQQEYSSQQPRSGSNEQRSPSVVSSLPVRRSYFPTITQSPSTPTIQPGNRRYLDRPSPLSADSARLTEARQQRVASLGQYPSVGRQRASSLSRRLRQSSLDAS
ncbi:hypothetical protein MMC14_004418 [Varicellaria rhodocarpa]|nr:hypothetical protein [Varicellaria rhodocarpa]